MTRSPDPSLAAAAAPVGPAPGRLAVRAGVLAALACAQIPLLAFLFDPFTINASDEAWRAMRAVLREGVPLMLFFLLALALILTPKARALASDWTAASSNYRWRAFLLANLCLFGALVPATLALNAPAPGAPPWAFFFAWLVATGTMTGLLALAAAPVSYWRRFIAREWPALLLAGGAAGLVVAAFVLSRQSWNALSGATFHLAAAILNLYESDVVVDPDGLILGARAFTVRIDAACSGYEGIGLVATFVSLYLWLFRRELRFPNAWLLIPAGIAAIWLLNGVRIAALVSLGAHVSEEVAITGFHSQAGWMMFLVVTIGIMVASHRSSFFRKQKAGPAQAGAGSLAVALLAPFLAILAASIIAAAFSAAGDPLYGLKVLAGAAALYLCRRSYARADFTPSLEGVALGLVVGAVWIATDPHRGEISEVKIWFDGLGPAAAALWLAARLAGTILIVPAAEELAFRGYIHRKAAAKHIEDAPVAAFAWPSLIVSTVLFGAIHERWLAGALAGAVFAIALYRSGRLGGAVSAHVAANALIALWALFAGQWTLL